MEFGNDGVMEFCPKDSNGGVILPEKFLFVNNRSAALSYIRTCTY